MRSFENSLLPKAYLLLLALLLAAPQIASAGPIFLSGDANITNALVGDAVPVDPGNQQFFVNVLDGGTEVAVLQAGPQAGSTDTHLSDFYDGLTGVTATTIAGAVTSASLAGVNLFLTTVPDDAFTISEIDALEAFSAAGGTIFFLGDNSVAAAAQNGFINAALTALGAGMNINTGFFDSGVFIATGSQIVSDPFTAGVTTLSYAAPASIAGGKHLFLGTADQPFVGYVPEPSTGLLVLAGLLGLAGHRRAQR